MRLKNFFFLLILCSFNFASLIKLGSIIEVVSGKAKKLKVKSNRELIED